MQTVMNLKIKFRESFRPFAPSVLVDDVSKYFEMETESPYMLIVAPVRRDRRLPMNVDNSLESDDNMLEIINQRRSDIPAVTHVDYSARIHTVHPDDNPDYHGIITEFKKLTGCGVVVNTSFNVRGEPIVCSPRDAYQCFMRTDLDLLVIEDYFLWKDQQPEFDDVENWREIYELD
jgi:carbamoyltransferase